MSADVFKNKIRIRVNGILTRNDAILLVKLHSPLNDKLVWMPPGGGVQFGEPMKASLQREFIEETGLSVEVGLLAFINELVKPPFHAVECYFHVQKTGGDLRLGEDPELAENEQLLEELQWVGFDELDNIALAPKQLKQNLLGSSSKSQAPNFYS